MPSSMYASSAYSCTSWGWKNWMFFSDWKNVPQIQQWIKFKWMGFNLNTQKQTTQAWLTLNQPKLNSPLVLHLRSASEVLGDKPVQMKCNCSRAKSGSEQVLPWHGLPAEGWHAGPNILQPPWLMQQTKHTDIKPCSTTLWLYSHVFKIYMHKQPEDISHVC